MCEWQETLYRPSLKSVRRAEEQSFETRLQASPAHRHRTSAKPTPQLPNFFRLQLDALAKPAQ